GAMPEAGKSKVQGPKSKVEKSTSPSAQDSTPHPAPLLGRGGEGEAQPEVIHSRSVQMGSERLGVVAKMDLVESKVSSSRGEEAHSLPAQEDQSLLTSAATIPQQVEFTE